RCLRRSSVSASLAARADRACRAQPRKRGESLSQTSGRGSRVCAHPRPPARPSAPTPCLHRSEGHRAVTGQQQNLALGAIANCAFNALIDGAGRVVWCCLPRPDGDPVFHWLLAGQDNSAPARGIFSVEMENVAQTRQPYIENTAVLVTELF